LARAGRRARTNAANLLKPALARGELRTIAGNHLVRVQKILREGRGAGAAVPGSEGGGSHPKSSAALMLRGLCLPLKSITICAFWMRLCEVGAAVSPYLAGRQLPDKAVSVLDTACARLSLGQNTTPPAIEDTHRQIDDLETQKRVLEREALVGADHGNASAPSIRSSPIDGTS